MQNRSSLFTPTRLALALGAALGLAAATTPALAQDAMSTTTTTTTVATPPPPAMPMAMPHHRHHRHRHHRHHRRHHTVTTHTATETRLNNAAADMPALAPAAPLARPYGTTTTRPSSTPQNAGDSPMGSNSPTPR